MGKNININVHHVTRIEGHGNILVDIKDGQIKEIKWEVPEAPRFFEAMVRGRTYKEVHTITSRICGICSIGHTLASVKATENAMGIQITKRAELMRHMAIHAENLQSHVLHLGYLVAPDLLKVNSVVPLVATHGDVVKKIIHLHRLANEFSDFITGRTIHPITIIPGGFTQYPTEDGFKEFKKKLEESVSALNAVADVIYSLADKLPKFTRETEYVALVPRPGSKEYPLYDGLVGSNVAKPFDAPEYPKHIQEYVNPASTAKYAKYNKPSYMAGALARFNLNAPLLTPKAKALADKFGLKAVCTNPFMNNVAQLVEAVFSVELSLQLIDEFLKMGVKQEKVQVTPKAGRGASAVEVPRGILFHDYTYDDKGVCQAANCIIPTNQNHANIQADMEAFVPQLLSEGKDQAEMQFMLEMLVRAYDPCVSCSTHFLKVAFKK